MNPLASGQWLTRERILRIAVISAAGGIAMLLILWLARHGTVDPFGQPVGTDFTAFWDAGRLANAGRAADAWNPVALNAHVTATHGISYQTAWMYPPIFLLLIAPFATLPYLPALAMWQAASVAAVAAALRTLLPDRRALLIALASPLTALVLANGQNAFVTAALLCAGLTQLERRPLLAGALLGGLAFKPQLALIIVPLLLFTRNWRATASAAILVLLLSVASLALWGVESWRAFIDGSSVARMLLETGGYGLHKSVSLFSMMRQWGAPIWLSYGMQGMGAFVAVVLIWSLRSSSALLRSAAVCGGVALSTPYLMDYDMASVGVGAAFLYVAAQRDGFLPYERSALAFIWAAPWFSRLAAEMLTIPLGPIAMIMLLAFTMRRARATLPSQRIAPAPILRATFAQ